MLSIPQLDTLNKPYHIFTDYVEHEALKQFISVMEKEDTLKGALMPDVHAGYTLPIGGVVLSKDRIYPEYVGVDIGCGMVSVVLEDDATQAEVCQWDPSKAAAIIRGAVPVGFSSHTTPVEIFTLPKVPESIKDLVEKASIQMGTLGGGNHFIEIGRSNSSGNLCLTLHSGSRGLGHKVATKYMQLSKGNGFQKGDPLFDEYKEAMNFTIAWAYYNRMTMIRLVCDALGLKAGEMVTCVHNFATETSEGVVHYKGANNLPEGVKGIIPANMRDGVYVVKGKGSVDAMDAVSHGAGRTMSRGEAKRKFSLENFQEAMKMGVDNPNAFPVDAARIDECPMAYKPIDTVMENQKELCRVVDIIRPILNVKG